MRRVHLFPVVGLLSALVLGGCGRGEIETVGEAPVVNVRVDDFGLYDHRGGFHTLYYHRDAAAIVLFVQGNGCPIARNALTALRDVQDAYAPRGVRFFMINANLQDDRAGIAAEAEAFGIDLPILVDESQLVAESLGLHRTAEALVIDPSTWRTIYRGPIDDRLNYEGQRAEASEHYLADALEAQLTGQPIETPVRMARGCLIALPGRDQDHTRISYAADVAPILQQKCQHCHQPGGIGPWAMAGYDVVRGWAPMMREVLRTRRMPPWHADPHVGTFSNDLSLTQAERQTLVHWIEAGAPRGDGEDPLAASLTETSGWILGTPDHVIQLQPQDVPATGVLDYRYEEVELPMERDVWVKAVEVQPDNRAVLHHLLVSVTYPDGTEAPLERRNRWLDGIFVAYAPGAEAEVFPEGTGRFLPAGSKLLFQLHYTTTGRPEVDASKLGLHFADEPPAREFMVVGPFNPRIEIPPQEAAYRASAEQVFEREATLYGLFPHMHFRGKSMRFTAAYPDGTAETLLSVPNYNFNWQRFYVLEEPKVLPAGTRVAVDAVFDNSPQNPYNPAPQDTVRWGDQSFDEMLIGYLSFHYGTPESLGAAMASDGREPVPSRTIAGPSR